MRMLKSKLLDLKEQEQKAHELQQQFMNYNKDETANTGGVQ